MKEERVVSTEEGQKYANGINASDFIETSAKYGENVENAFQNLVFQILKKLGEM